MHVLIIEDQSVIAAFIEEELQELGFTSFDRASSEIEAVELAKVRRPGLITADDRLASGSGVNAVRAICAGQRIPVVFIVGNPNELQTILPSAVIIGKPFSLLSLREAVEKAMPSACLRISGESTQHGQAQLRQHLSQ